jgi:hypothetical protein
VLSEVPSSTPFRRSSGQQLSLCNIPANGLEIGNAIKLSAISHS